MLATTDQYRYCRSLEKYLKKLYINSYTHILNKIIYFMSINMVSGNIATVQALLNHMQFMSDSIDSGNFVISAFLDFKKAFDTVVKIRFLRN